MRVARSVGSIGAGSALCSLFMVGCTWFLPAQPQELEVSERLRVAILPIWLNVEITSLSAVKTIEPERPDEDETVELADTLDVVRQEARWILQSRLATRQVFLFAPQEQTDAAVADLEIRPGMLPTRDQILRLRERLDVDLVVAATIEDYGKVRWQWLLAGMLTDMTIDNFLVGLATAWNPVALSASIGWDLLTSTPVWFGGGYLFGVAFRPVRVEARAYETLHGYPIWQDMESAIYAWRLLKQLPEEERKKKERQLWINLDLAVEALADSLADAQMRADARGASNEIQRPASRASSRIRQTGADS